MGTKTLPQLPAATPLATDIIIGTADPSGAPLSKKFTVAAIVAAGIADCVGNAAITGSAALKNPSGGASQFAYDPSMSPALIAIGGTPITSAKTMLHVWDVPTAVDGYCLIAYRAYTPPVTGSNHFSVGIACNNYSEDFVAGDISSLTGLWLQNWHRGTGHLLNSYGIDMLVRSMRSGTTDNLYGLHSVISSHGVDTTVTNGYGLHQSFLSSGGQFGNLYGLKIEDVNLGITLNYAIYTGAGNIRFGGLPTSSAGLATGTLWNDSGTVKIA